MRIPGTADVRVRGQERVCKKHRAMGWAAPVGPVRAKSGDGQFVLRFRGDHEEAGKIEVADVDLSRLEREGAQILTLVATPRMAAKVIALFPHQTLPEHWHPPHQ